MLVSTAFLPGANHTPSTPDMILMSSENVFFYVHSYRILPLSNNSFGHIWPSRPIENIPPLVILPESSSAIHMLLHVVYNLPFDQYNCSNEDLINSIDALNKYGFSIHHHVAPESQLHRYILSLATIFPLDMYAISAKYDLNELATQISPLLLSYDLSNLTDGLVQMMGATYLRKLLFLHLDRIEALKRLLSPPAPYHLPSTSCGDKDHKEFIRAWNLTVLSMVWIIEPAVEPLAIVAELAPVAKWARCSTCKTGVKMTVKNIVLSWANEKTCI